MPPSRLLSVVLAPAFVLGLLAPAGAGTPRGAPEWPEAGDYDEPPRALKITKPHYPRDAFKKKIEGVVETEILIDAEGKVARARVVKSVPALDHAALETVYRWRFSPAMKNGRPVATIAKAPVMFRIYSGPTPPPGR